MLFKRLTIEDAQASYIYLADLEIYLENIEQILGIKFEFFIDDLGEAYDAVIETKNGIRIVFVSRKAPYPQYLTIGVLYEFFRNNKDCGILLKNELSQLGIPVDTFCYFNPPRDS